MDKRRLIPIAVVVVVAIVSAFLAGYAALSLVREPPTVGGPPLRLPAAATDWTPEERAIIDHFLRAPPTIRMTTGSVGRLPPGRVQQVIDDKSFLVAGRQGEAPTVLVSGVDTSDMFDGQRWQPESLFLCTGPFRFVSVGAGQRTVMRVEAVSGRKLEAAALRWAERERADNLQKAGVENPERHP